MIAHVEKCFNLNYINVKGSHKNTLGTMNNEFLTHPLKSNLHHKLQIELSVELIKYLDTKNHCRGQNLSV